jgi:hypothetical protein
MTLKLVCRLLSTLPILVVLSCNDLSKEETEFYKQLDSTLIRSNQAIRSATTSRIRKLEQQTNDPGSTEKAQKWYAKAQVIRSISEEVYEQADQIRKDLTSGKTTSPLARINNLREKINDCRRKLLNIDPELSSQFGNLLPMLSDFNSLKTGNQETVALLVRLGRLQSDLRVTENMMVDYCSKKMADGDGWYDVYFPITFGHNSVYYPGERAEIKAGIGSFSSKAIPEITVNGNKAVRTPEGYYQYLFSVSEKPGIYTAILAINYIDPNTGQPTIVKKIIRYKVIPKCPE